MGKTDDYRPKPPTAEVQESQMKVERTVKGKDTATEDSLLDVHIFATSPAHANARIQRTVNLGDYESIQLSVGVSLPCYTEELEQGLNFAIAMAAERLQVEVDDTYAALAVRKKAGR